MGNILQPSDVLSKRNLAFLRKLKISQGRYMNAFKAVNV
jgi:hypothetical protein